MPPVEVVAGIIFEDENIIDLGLMPYAASQAEYKKEHVGEEVSSIDLRTISLVA